MTMTSTTTTAMTFPLHAENVTVDLVEFSQYLDNRTAFLFKVLMFSAGLPLVCIAGIVTNVINLVVFSRQGVTSDSSTASLFCLAVSDLVCSVTGLWMGVGFGVVVADPPGLNFDPFQVLLFPAAEIHLTFETAARTITAYISLERCLSVVSPFKAKLWFNAHRSLAINLALFICNIFMYLPTMLTKEFRYITDRVTNETRVVLAVKEHNELMLYIRNYVVNAADTASVVTVLLCTTITVSRVKLSKAWRNSVTKAENLEVTEAPQTDKAKPAKMADKEERLVNTVTAISVILLVCFLPKAAMSLAHAIDRDIYVRGRQSNLAFAIYSVGFVMEGFNSTLNIFVYYRLSSRYRQEFDNLRKKGLKQKK